MFTQTTIVSLAVLGLFALFMVPLAIVSFQTRGLVAPGSRPAE